MKKIARPAPKTGIITRSGGKTSFRKLDPDAEKPKTKKRFSRDDEDSKPRSTSSSRFGSEKSEKRTTKSFTGKSSTGSRRTSAKSDERFDSKPDSKRFSRGSSADNFSEEIPSSGKKFGEKKFGEKKFGDKKFGEKKFSDRKFNDKEFGEKKFSDRKFENKNYGEKKFSDKKFTDKKFGEKSSSTKPAKAGIGGRTKAAKTNPDAVLRLNRFIADAGICSRRQADEYIEQGAVKVNGKLVTEHGTKVHLSDLVTVNGEPVNAEKHLTYVVLNKPKDYITTTSDEKGRKTVMELIPLKQRIYPIGRLDRHTTGVLLLTNDGDLAHRLMHPSYGVSRIYRAYLDKRLTQADLRNISKGVEVEGENGETYISGECNVAMDPEDPRAVTLELAEGKNREVRRIFAALGYEVERLDRKAYAGVSSRGLGRGEYRHLTQMEVRALEQLVKLDRRLEQATTSAKPRTKSRRG